MTIETLRDSPTETHLMFLDRLTSGGQTLVPPFDPGLLKEVIDSEDVRSFYRSLHAARAEDAPCVAPELEIDSAIWGGLVCHWAGWAILDRGQDEGIPEGLRRATPVPSIASTHWSVDLILAVWPQIHDRCRQIAEDDPLKRSILEIAIRWPLSAIGMKLDPDTIHAKILGERSWKTIAEHSSLRRIAQDRAERAGEVEFRMALTRDDSDAKR